MSTIVWNLGSGMLEVGLFVSGTFGVVEVVEAVYTKSMESTTSY